MDRFWPSLPCCVPLKPPLPPPLPPLPPRPRPRPLPTSCPPIDEESPAPWAGAGSFLRQPRLRNDADLVPKGALEGRRCQWSADMFSLLECPIATAIPDSSIFTRTWLKMWSESWVRRISSTRVAADELSRVVEMMERYRCRSSMCLACRWTPDERGIPREVK